MVSNRLFARRRDGRLESRLNAGGRGFAESVFTQVVAAQGDPQHSWHASLSAPINPANDVDDPLSVLARQNDTTSNAELALASVNEQFLSDAEGWAWLTTFQVALRSLAVSSGVLSEDRLGDLDLAQRQQIETVQLFLFSLAECL